MQPFHYIYCHVKKTTMRLPYILACLVIVFSVICSCTKISVDKSATTAGSPSGITTGDGAFSSIGGGGGVSGGDSIVHAACVLTAGEWNDFDNWPYWQQLNNKDTLKDFQARWGFYPNEKWMFTVKDAAGRPVADAGVIITSNGLEVWSGRTNRFGILQVVPGIFSAILPVNMKYKISYEDQEYPGAALTKANREIAVTLNTKIVESATVDLMFVVDATGSMGDEIIYLKNELKDVLSRAARQVPGSLRYAGIFYRDFGDEYITRVNEFSGNNTSLISFVADQKADGGGDYPEAVEEALKAAVQQQWSEHARARILFLILDAPVHDDEQKIKQLKEQVKLAAAKGIMIIPISASGTDKPAEFLFRFIAQATNGTYTFLTDDSGVGESHIAPTVGHYDVEFLNDLMVRLITKYGGN